MGISGAVDFGCGAVSSSAAAGTLLATFDATGAVLYSRVVQLVGSGPVVVDGFGGISIAVQVGNGIDCNCTTNADCAIVPEAVCYQGYCGDTCSTLAEYTPGPIWISRFAP